MLNVKAIEKVLMSTPLCYAALVQDKGMAKEYCAVGALARNLGASDEWLHNISQGNVSLVFNTYKTGFIKKFGIESADVLAEFMCVNDTEPDILRRNKQVVTRVLDKKVAEVSAVLTEFEPENYHTQLETVKA